MSPSTISLPADAPTAPANRSLWRNVLFTTSTSLNPTLLRLSVAVVMFPHGAQKLFGWFGGYGFGGTMQFFTDQMGIPYALGAGAILVEFFAPILLVLGFLTRPAAISLGVVMAVAMVTVQWEHGFFMNWYGQQAGEGIQFTLLLLGAVAALAVSGGGAASVDRALQQPAND
jgi:putative oxidoreductase